MSSPQREAYTLPSQRDPSSSSQQQTSGSGGGASNAQAYSAFAAGHSAGDGSTGPKVQYLCGECNSKVVLGRGDAIRCSNCGHRVLYKERTKRMVQFEAR